MKLSRNPNGFTVYITAREMHDLGGNLPLGMTVKFERDGSIKSITEAWDNTGGDMLNGMAADRAIDNAEKALRANYALPVYCTPSWCH